MFLKTGRRVVAFTLVELLVVIAIIALLASLLLPALGSAKARGKEMTCTSNLRQCAFARNMYASDFGDTIIQYLYLAGGVYSKGKSATWLQILDGTWDVLYLTDRKVVLCPSFAPERYLGGSYFGRIYGAVDLPVGGGPFKPAGFDGGVMIKIPQVVSPSTMPTLGDSIGSLGTQIYILYPTLAGTAGMHLRHSGGGNMLFLDGHAKNIRRAEARTMLEFTKGYLLDGTQVDL